MRVICPACGAVSSLEALLTDGDARQFMSELVKFPSSVLRLIPPYLALFRTGKALQWRKGKRLLSELLAEVQKEYIQINNRPARPGSDLFWQKGLEKITEQPPSKLPLKNHRYLMAIVYDFADEQDRLNEQQRSKRYYENNQETTQPKRVETYPTLEQIRKMRQESMKKFRESSEI